MTRLVDENGAPRYLIVEFSKTEAEQPAQDCTVQAAAQGEKNKRLARCLQNEGADKGADFGAARGDGAGLWQNGRTPQRIAAGFRAERAVSGVFGRGGVAVDGAAGVRPDRQPRLSGRNKRTGAHAMLVFLAVNGIEMEYAQEELIAIILLMASDRADCGALAQ